MNGTKTSYIAPLFEPLSKAGFAWFTINYRLAPQHRFPACLEDVESAIRWVKAHASEYKADPRRIALIGESAGGHLVSLAGARAAADTRVAAVVPFAQSLRFQERMKAAGNICDLIAIEGGAHGLGGWEKLDPAYKAKLVAWLHKTLDTSR